MLATLTPQEALLPRYDRARAVMLELARTIGQTMLTQDMVLRLAGQIGLRSGRFEIEFANDAEVCALQDFLMYGDIRGGRNTAARYLQRFRSELTEEEQRCLEAMSAARYTLLEVREPAPGVGVHCFDVLADREFFVHDRNWGRSTWSDGVFGSRVVDQGDFRMLTGAMLPTHIGILDRLRDIASPALKARLARRPIELGAHDQAMLQRLVIRLAKVTRITELVRYE